MFKIPKQAYTAEFRTLAVQRVKGGQSARDVARELGISHQSLRNWVKADYATAGGGADHPISGGVLREGPPVKYAWIDSHRWHYPLSALCGVLSVSLNGYRACSIGKSSAGRSSRA